MGLSGAVLCACACAGAGLVMPEAARAAAAAALAPPPARSRVVVLMVDPAVVDPLVARIEGEMRSVGLTVRRIEIDSGSDLEAVVSQAIAGGAGAVVRIIPRSKGTEVWTGDTRARVLRRRATSASVSDAALSILAFRSVEFLRASLLEVPASVLRPAAEPPRPSADSPPRTAVSTPPPRSPPAPPPSVAPVAPDRAPPSRRVIRPPACPRPPKRRFPTTRPAPRQGLGASRPSRRSPP